MGVASTHKGSKPQGSHEEWRGAGHKMSGEVSGVSTPKPATPAPAAPAPIQVAMPRAVAQPKPQPQPQQPDPVEERRSRKLEGLVRELAPELQLPDTYLKITVNDESKELEIALVNAKNDAVIRTVPPKSLFDLARQNAVGRGIVLELER